MVWCSGYRSGLITKSCRFKPQQRTNFAIIAFDQVTWPVVPSIKRTASHFRKVTRPRTLRASIVLYFNNETKMKMKSYISYNNQWFFGVSLISFNLEVQMSFLLYIRLAARGTQSCFCSMINLTPSYNTYRFGIHNYICSGMQLAMRKPVFWQM